MSGTVVVVFVEGETDKEFYNKLKNHLRKQNGKPFKCKIEIKNLTGVSNYKLRASRIFEKAIKPKYPACKYKVALCYDTDVFEYSQKPPVDWSQVSTALKNKGATKVIQVKAKSSIEDWFLYDQEGIKKYLGLSKSLDISKYKGQSGLSELFRKANRVYIKGNKCEGLIEGLDIGRIISHIQDEIKPLIELLK